MSTDYGISIAIEQINNIIEKCNGYKEFLERTKKDLENGADPLERIMASRFTHAPLLDSLKEFLNDTCPHVDLIETPYKIITTLNYFKGTNGFVILAIKNNDFKVLSGTPSFGFSWGTYNYDKNVTTFMGTDKRFITFDDAMNEMLNDGYELFAFRSTLDLRLYCSNKMKQNITKLALDIVNEFSDMINEFENGKPITKLCYGLNNEHLKIISELKKEITNVF